MNNLFRELKERHVFRVAVAYAAVAWVIAQIAEFAFDTFGVEDAVLQYLVIALLLGLPIAVVLAWIYEITPQGIQRDVDVARDDDAQGSGRAGRRYPLILLLLVLIAGLGTFGLYQHRQSAEHMQSAIASLEQARELVAEDQFGKAFMVLQDAIPILADSPEVGQLMASIVIEIKPRLTAADADALVSFRPYDVPDAPWIQGSPGEPLLAPKGGLLLRLEKPGRESREFAVANPGPMLQNVDPIVRGAIDYPIPELALFEPGNVSKGMVRIPTTDFPIFLSGFAIDTLGDQRYQIPGFDIAAQEVTNEEFKSFVDDGGYQDPFFWQGLRLTDGTPVDEAIIATFVDTTGRPGPSHWELGNYARGAAQLPVGGISLYEAKAYARYRGMALPTIHHWSRAAFAPMEGIAQIAPFVARDSSFGDAAVPAATALGIGPWGTRQMAGNAREWVWNTSNELGLAMGGAWNDYDDVFQTAYTIAPLDRAPQNGLRLMHTLGEPVAPQLLAPIDLNQDAVSARRQPVDDAEFEALRFQFSHIAKVPLSTNSETAELNDSWSVEEIELKFSDDRVLTLFVVRPVNPVEKLQPVLYMPHSGAVQAIPNRKLLEQMRFMDYVVRAGRAVVIPVMAGFAQRYREMPPEEPAKLDFLRRRTLARYDDIATTIDYLESRADMDADSVGFLGFSYGAYQSASFLAIENRIKTIVLISGGAPYWDFLDPLADPVNFLPRVMQPALLINGRYDHLFTYENSQRHMLELLGASDENKRHLVFEEGHFDFPRNTVAREVSNWLDQYLGPVR